MSWWTDFRDAGESLISDVSPIDIRSDSARKKTSGVAGFGNRVRNKEEGAFNTLMGRQSASDKRMQNQMLSDQINAYKEQTELTRKQLEDTRNQMAAEKRRVQEKQIRSLRSNYRSQGIGMLGSGQPASNDMDSKLGG